MQIDTWSSIVGLLASRLADLLFGAAGGFVAAWLSYRYGIKRDLTKISAELDQSIRKSRVEKTSQTADDIWRALQEAMEKSAILTAMYKQYPEFRFMSNEALEELLKVSFLTENQRKELRSAPDKNEYYINARFWFDLNAARQSHYRLNADVQANRIHLPQDLLSTLDELVSTLNGLFISYEIWHKSDDANLLMKAREEIAQASELSNKAEAQIRSILDRAQLPDNA